MARAFACCLQIERGVPPAGYLCFAIKTFAWPLPRLFPSTLVTKFLECYLVRAMRIPLPRSNSTFRATARGTADIKSGQTEPSRTDAGRKASHTLDVREATDQTDENFAAAVAVYHRVFPPGPLTVNPTTFARSIARVRGRKRLHYHFWALAERPGAPAHGMSAFFVMPRFGFGGYIALEPPLIGRGLSRVVLQRIEEQMICDEPGAREWYIECDPGSTQQRIFERLGFVRVPVSYHQPPLVAQDNACVADLGPELCLMRKGLGDEIGRWKFSVARFRPVLHQILAEVYRVPDPERSASFRQAVGENS